MLFGNMRRFRNLGGRIWLKNGNTGRSGGNKGIEMEKSEEIERWGWVDGKTQ
jgi:hypothetical protein